MSITEKRLDEIRARLAAATEGPWLVDGPAQCGPGDTLTVYPVKDGGTLAYVQPYWGDAEFISRAREDIPALLAEVERLRDELAKAREITEDKVERAALVDLNMGLKFRGLGPVKSLEEIKPILGEEGPYRLRSTMRAALIAVLGGGKNV